MNLEHPYILLVAVAIAVPFAFPLARFFFHHYSQFIEDVGLSTRDDRFVTGLFVFLGGLPCPPFFKTLGFVLSLAAIIGTAYHALAFIVAHASLPPHGP
jgi:hypothetical protein